MNTDHFLALLFSVILLLVAQTTSLSASAIPIYSLQEYVSWHDGVILGKVEKIKLLKKERLSKCVYLVATFFWEDSAGSGQIIYPEGLDGPGINNLDDHIAWIEQNDFNELESENENCGAIYTIKVIETLKGNVKEKEVEFYSTSNFLTANNYLFFLNETEVILPTYSQYSPKYYDKIGFNMDVFNASFYLDIINYNEAYEDWFVRPHNIYIKGIDGKIENDEKIFLWVEVKAYIDKVVKKLKRSKR